MFRFTIRACAREGPPPMEMAGRPDSGPSSARHSAAFDAADLKSLARAFPKALTVPGSLDGASGGAGGEMLVARVLDSRRGIERRHPARRSGLGDEAA